MYIFKCRVYFPAKIEKILVRGIHHTHARSGGGIYPSPVTLTIYKVNTLDTYKAYTDTYNNQELDYYMISLNTYKAECMDVTSDT